MMHMCQCRASVSRVGDAKKEMLKEMSSLTAATASSLGTYGGPDSYSVLANMLQLQIFCLDKSTPHQYKVWLGNTKGSCPVRPMRSFQMDLEQARESDSVVVVEFNGAHSALEGPILKNVRGHWAGYIPPEGRVPELPTWLAKRVRK